MNWKKPQQQIFFLPVPDKGQNRTELIEHKITPGAAPMVITLTDPYQKTNYQAEVLDYFGPYPADKLPDTFSQAATDKKIITGAILIEQLRRRQPAEFKTAKNIFFYLMCQILPNDQKNQ
jgi:hypothetical protein